MISCSYCTRMPQNFSASIKTVIASVLSKPMVSGKFWVHPISPFVQVKKPLDTLSCQTSGKIQINEISLLQFELVYANICAEVRKH